MSPAEIALFTIIVFLFIIAIYQFVLFRRSHEKKQWQPKYFEYKDIVDITPEFKFETPGLNNVEIHQIKDLIKPITGNGIAETDTETISIEEKIRRQKKDLRNFPDLDNKIHEIKYDIQNEIKDEIPKTEPEFIESHAKEDIFVPVTMMENDSGLKLEDTLIEIEEERKKKRRIASNKSDPFIKTAIVPPAKPLMVGKASKK